MNSINTRLPLKRGDEKPYTGLAERLRLRQNEDDQPNESLQPPPKGRDKRKWPVKLSLMLRNGEGAVRAAWLRPVRAEVEIAEGLKKGARPGAGIEPRRRWREQ